MLISGHHVPCCDNDPSSPQLYVMFIGPRESQFGWLSYLVVCHRVKGGGLGPGCSGCNSRV